MGVVLYEVRYFISWLFTGHWLYEKKMLLVLKMLLVFWNGMFVSILIKFPRPWNSRGKISGPERSNSSQSRTQLACLDLLTTLPPQHEIEYVIKMYSLIEGKFNILLQERIVR